MLKLILAYEEQHGLFDLVLLVRMDQVICGRPWVCALPSEKSLSLKVKTTTDVSLDNRTGVGVIRERGTGRWVASTRIRGKYIYVPRDAEPPLHAHAREVFYDGAVGNSTAVQHLLVTPRAGDSNVVGRARALHDLAHGIVYHGWNMTLSIGKCDVHGILAATSLRIFSTRQIAITNTSACPKGFQEYAKGSSYARNVVMCRNATRDAPGHTEDRRACIKRYCAGFSDSLTHGFRKRKP